MATITVPADFFRGELRVYSDWREALARELLQNATDANPSRIDVTLEDVDADEFGPARGRVTFSDDGHGMSRDVLENVFFALGKTTKTGEGSIGGFGRARIIICFAQLGYRIETGNLIAQGVGGTYTIRESEHYVRGTRFVIDLIDQDVSRVRYAFLRVLETSTVKVPLLLNGTAAPSRNMPARATRILRDENDRGWGRLYVEPNGSSRVLVRVHGLTMFTRWLYGSVDDDIVLELDPAMSREVLSASRDSLHTTYGDQLDQFISDLDRNRRAALRPPAAPLDLRVGGGGFLATDAFVINVNDVNDSVDTDSDEDRLDSASGTRVRVTPANEAAFTNHVNRPAARDGQLDLLDFTVEEPAVPALGFDVYLMADSADAHIRRLAKMWDPTGWDATTGTRRRSLLMTWKAAVGYSLDLLVATRPSTGRVLWTVGWTFDQDVLAMHRTAGDGHILALNPVTKTGKARFHLSQRASRQELLAIALHEAAHVVCDGHDETFAAVLTDLFAKVDPAAADRVMRAAAAT